MSVTDKQSIQIKLPPSTKSSTDGSESQVHMDSPVFPEVELVTLEPESSVLDTHSEEDSEIPKLFIPEACVKLLIQEFAPKFSAYRNAKNHIQKRQLINDVMEKMRAKGYYYDRRRILKKFLKLYDRYKRVEENNKKPDGKDNMRFKFLDDFRQALKVEYDPNDLSSIPDLPFVGESDSGREARPNMSIIRSKKKAKVERGDNYPSLVELKVEKLRAKKDFWNRLLQIEAEKLETLKKIADKLST